MAEIFNSFFVTIASDIDSKIIYTNTNYKDYLQQSVPQTCFGSYTSKRRSFRLELSKIEDLPEQEDKRSISKINKKRSS